MAQNDFEASPPVTGGDRERANNLTTNAALAMKSESGLAPQDPLKSDSSQESSIDAVESDARTALHDIHPDLRATAVGALSTIGRFGLSDLQNLQSDTSPIVRRRAVEAATELIADLSYTESAIELIQLLVKFLTDDAVVSEVASFALGEFGSDHPAFDDPESLVWLGELETMATGHADPLCRESAVAALGALHRGEATVLAAMKDKATVRRRAIIALAPFDGPEVDAAIATALADRDWQVRQGAEDQHAARQN